ncbi:NmrA family NAD(P)-binding protein [Longimicrobium sp.]|uniref:NmrA family NAD(P)-binding protein n=1 Tax=Longimicrobium sp. TaxID=2029185 RepID=UPI002E318A3B|nr:NmrA family NAD(P)-binding protein [Longimicrobium sp.]HEX6039198.1 NmrA family NAD(P)-binding protein [Longimicrobium sp.]
MTDKTVVLAGATGDLGGRIARALLARGATVRALARPGAAPDTVARLRGFGAEVATADYGDAAALRRACAGAACVVSALSGLREVIVDAQTRLLEAAVGAGVPRFIPSDFAIDFTKLPPGSNRNLDLRREFKQRLDGAPIAATSILCGAFMDMLTGVAPFILFKRRRVLVWQNADQRMDFTTKDDTAAFTAAAALDPSTPRILRIAGDTLSANDLAALMTDVSGQRYRLLRAGRLGLLRVLIRIARTVAPQPGEVYPPWQGMQYMHDMFSGRGELHPLDNGRYPELRWTTARDVLAAHVGSR